MDSGQRSGAHHDHTTEPAPEPALRRARLLVAYDGAPFHGFADNPGVPTVVGRLTDAIQRVVRHPVVLTGAGRTDAGVHAFGQVVSLDVPAGVDLADLMRRVNKMCAPAVVVRDAAWVAADFDARFSATARRYRYDVLNARVGDPSRASVMWHVAVALDLDAMNAAASSLIGEHDFSSFCRRPKVAAGQPSPSLRRRVVEAAWTETSTDRGGRVLRFEIEANAFCHQMVRSIVGTLVDVGLGRIAPTAVATILAVRDRAGAGRVAPPHGLCLWHVGYAGG